MATNASSHDTLIRDSQLSGFSAFKERIGYFCCRLLKQTEKYDLATISKDDPQEHSKQSTVNEVLQEEKQARQEKLDQIAKTLPEATTPSARSIRTPNPGTNASASKLTTATDTTARSGIGLAQAKPPTNAPVTRSVAAARPQALPANSQHTKRDSEETTDTSEEESSSDDEKSSDSESTSAK